MQQVQPQQQFVPMRDNDKRFDPRQSGAPARNTSDSRGPCCGMRHENGARIVGIIEWIFLLLKFILCILQFRWFTKDDSGSGEGFGVALGAMAFTYYLIEIGILIALFMGLKNANHQFLLPHIIGQIFNFIIIIVNIIFMIPTLDSIVQIVEYDRKYEGQYTFQGYSADHTAQRTSEAPELVFPSCFLAFLGTILIVEIWFYVVIFKCWKHFREMNKY